MSRGEVETILDPVSLSQLEKIGDWLVLYFIVKNLDLLTVNQVRIHNYIISFETNTSWVEDPGSDQVLLSSNYSHLNLAESCFFKSETFYLKSWKVITNFKIYPKILHTSWKLGQINVIFHCFIQNCSLLNLKWKPNLFCFQIIRKMYKEAENNLSNTETLKLMKPQSSQVWKNDQKRNCHKTKT